MDPKKWRFGRWCSFSFRGFSSSMLIFRVFITSNNMFQVRLGKLGVIIIQKHIVFGGCCSNSWNSKHSSQQFLVIYGGQQCWPKKSSSRWGWYCIPHPDYSRIRTKDTTYQHPLKEISFGFYLQRRVPLEKVQTKCNVAMPLSFEFWFSNPWAYQGFLFGGSKDIQDTDPAWVEGKVVYPIMYRCFYIPGGAGFLPSTVHPGRLTAGT